MSWLRDLRRSVFAASRHAFRYARRTLRASSRTSSALAPSYLRDSDLYAFVSRLQRHAASPGSFAGFIDLLYATDISGML
jgi:hypothetical protein